MAGHPEDSIFDATCGTDASSPKRIDPNGAESAPSRDATPAVAEKPAGFKEPAVVVNDAVMTRQTRSEGPVVDARQELETSRPPTSGGAGADSAPDVSERREEQPARPTEYGSTVEELWREVEAALLGAQGGTTETSQRRMSGGTGAELAPETNEATNVSKEGGDAEQISTA
jgi:hypothetical protein